MIPHTSDPLIREDFSASYEMRAWMEFVTRDFPTETSANLDDIGSAVNISGKTQFKFLGNTTTGRVIYADGPAPGDLWLYMDGTTAHTPA